MYKLLSQYKQAVAKPQIFNIKPCPLYRGVKIPLLFPTLMRMWKTRWRRARIARIGRLKKHGKNR
jgi:hypothetical protein